ncbi:MAG: OmpA family protein [Immundisolibacteraceae bacterium]|nr:OmpA family protein [Immundisolibacteraceae bacterium]
MTQPKSVTRFLALAVMAMVLTGCASHDITSDWRNCAIAGAVAAGGLTASRDTGDEFAAAAGGAIVGGTLCALFGDKDSDGDGVNDSKDQCPNTPSGVAVDSKGCPTDLDGDGVADYLDACQGTPRGTKVDAKGCPLDSDGDGVADSKDQCPNTMAGAKVDSKGCVVIAALHGVHFELDSAKLTSKAKEILNESAATLKKSRASVMVAGHTDKTGETDYNMSLSESRAAAVVEYLTSQGVSRNKLSAKGYGEEKPIADNSTSMGRAKNRRVELHSMK